MSHPAQIEFVGNLKNKYPSYFRNKRILEIGSLYINGSIRQFFNNCAYLGVDIGIGSCVDLVANGEDLTFPDGSFDVVASCECFEHNPEWIKTFNNMVRMSSGLVFFSCATTGRPEHGTSRTSRSDAPFCGDYYRNLTESNFIENCDFSSFKEFTFSVNDSAKDLYFYGIK